MLRVIYLFSITHYYTGERENNIRNTCIFDILRIKKHSMETYCIDYGEHIKYCNHYAQPEEFIITNEKGLNKKDIVIKPSALWQETGYNRDKMADYYYTFTCNDKHKSPRLIQHIVPTLQYDIDPIYIIIQQVVLTILFIVCIRRIITYRI